MSVGPTGGLAERGHPFFRRPLLDTRVGWGYTQNRSRIRSPTPSPGGGTLPSGPAPGVKWLSDAAGCLIAIDISDKYYIYDYLKASNPPTPSILRVRVAPPLVIAGTSVYPPFFGCLSWIIAPATFVPFWSNIEE